MGGLTDETLLEYVLGLAPGKRLLYVPTADMEDPARTVWWYERLHGRAEMTHLHFSPWPPAHLRELVLGQDIVLVTGGNTANAGLAADDDVALHFVGTELHEVVTSRPGATAYRVGPEGERPLEARLLG